MGQEGSEQFLIQAAQEADVILIEGVMGLFDGMPSSADLARAFGIPVLVVISTQTWHKLQAQLHWACVANHVASPTHAQMIAASLRDHIPLLGTLPRQQRSLPERHLGKWPDYYPVRS